jgi:hypothetical protein
MSSTTAPKDFSDLYSDFQVRLRETTSVTATQNIAKRYISIALYDMHIGQWEKFYWAERSAVLRTQPTYSTGTVAITKGSSTLTGTDTLWNTNNDFSVANARTTGKIVIGGSEEVYTISAVGSDTSITLNEPFIDDTVTEASYVYFEDEYALHADFLRPVDAQSFSDNGEIKLISRTEFRRRYPRNKVTGKPEIATIVDRTFASDTTPVRRVRLWRSPDKAYLIPYSFITNKLAVTSAGVEQSGLVNDTDEPIVPVQYRHAIVFHALYHAYRDRKDDARAESAKAEYTDLMLRLIGDQEIGSPRPQIRPVRGPYVRRASRPYTGRGSSRYMLGTSFDEIR